MEDVEQRTLSTYPDPPPFWKRYIDDTCTALPPNQVQAFHAQFSPTTLESEKNDTEVTHHPDGSLATRVYRKATHTD